MMCTKILLPLDGSSLAEKALPFATAEAKAHGASLMLLRVVPPKFIGEPLTEAWQEALQATKEESGDYLAELAETVWNETLVDVKPEVGVGDPATVILETAEAEKCDLIVMSTHGFSGLERLMWGSVTDVVARMSRVPVVLIRPITVAASAKEAELMVGV